MDAEAGCVREELVDGATPEPARLLTDQLKSGGPCLALVTTGSIWMIAKTAKVTQRGALNLIGELGVREVTGRGRYRAWGIL